MSNPKPLYQHMATALDAHKRCKADLALIHAGKMDQSWLELREHWTQEWFDRLDNMMEHLPHGSGLDTDWLLDANASNANKLVFNTSYHHMNDGGYTHWSDVTITVKPSLIHGYELSIRGTDRDTKDYLYEILGDAFGTVYEQETFVKELRT